MNVKRRSAVMLAGFAWATISHAAAPLAGAEPRDPAAVVMPVDWPRFRKPVALDKEYEGCRRFLQNCARYHLGWIPKSFSKDPALPSYRLARFDEHGVRPACSVASRWMELRAAKMLRMQQRHPDGRMFAPGEYDTYPGAEQMMAWLLADALLALRLDAYQLLGRPADWLGR